MIFIRCPKCQSTHLKMGMQEFKCLHCGAELNLHDVQWMERKEEEPKKEEEDGRASIATVG
jgi:DNA-directed RNA polymerase subunit RPC12/RpoP